MNDDNIVKKMRLLPEDKFQQIDNLVNSMINQQDKQEEFKLTNYSELVSRQKDLMGRSNLASTLARIIDEDVKPPFVVGIYGKWGSGKTNFLDFFRDAIEKETSGKCIVQYFNAWKYETTGPIMYSLYKSIEELLPEERRKKLKKSELKRNLCRITAHFLKERFKFDLGNLSISNKVNKVTGWLDKNYESVKRVEEEFESTVAEVLSNKKKSILVVMVDDLDRCNPENVVLMLESMKNFFATKNCIFILAADKDVVASGIRHKYSNSKFISGDDYLDKIVNFSFDLKLEPSVGIRNLIDIYCQNYQSLLKDAKPEFLLDAFKKLRNQSVRTARRILDKYVLMLKIPGTSNIDYRVLLFTFILQEMLPDLYSDIKRYPEDTIIDSIFTATQPPRDTEYEKLPEVRVLIYKYAQKANVQSIIQLFKTHYIPEPERRNEKITPIILKSIHYIETFTLIP